MTAAPTELAPAPGARRADAIGSRAIAGAAVWRSPRDEELWWPTLLVAAIFCLITFYAKGGLNLESMTTTEMALTLVAGLRDRRVRAAGPARQARVRGCGPSGCCSRSRC